MRERIPGRLPAGHPHARRTVRPGRRPGTAARWRRCAGLLAAVVLAAGCAAGESAGSAAVVVPSSEGSGGSTAATLGWRGTTVDGKPFDSASLAGKPVVLWFWAPWCPTCLMQAPGVRAALAASGNSVHLVGVAGLDDAAAMPEFVRLAKVGSMTHVADQAGVIWKQFGIAEQSVFVFLDADGVQTFRGRLSSDDIPARVAELAG